MWKGEAGSPLSWTHIAQTPDSPADCDNGAQCGWLRLCRVSQLWQVRGERRRVHGCQVDKGGQHGARRGGRAQVPNQLYHVLLQQL